MDWKAEFASLAKEYGPALFVLIISWYRDRNLQLKHDYAVADLVRKHNENKEKIEKKFSGMSAADIIRELTSDSAD